MKCHEFKRVAEAFTPSELSLMRTEDQAISAHACECASCGRWLESQTLLGSAIEALRATTAELEAGPNVERTLLLAFRDSGFPSQLAVEPEHAAPAAWKLSRIFEFGAYAAVAAALIIAHREVAAINSEGPSAAAHAQRTGDDCGDWRSTGSRSGSN